MHNSLPSWCLLLSACCAALRESIPSSYYYYGLTLTLSHCCYFSAVVCIQSVAYCFIKSSHTTGQSVYWQFHEFLTWLWFLPYQCAASRTTATQCPGWKCQHILLMATGERRHWQQSSRVKTEQLGHKSYFQSFSGEGGGKSDEGWEYRKGQNINKTLAMWGKTYNILCCSVFTPIFWEWSARPAWQYFCSCSPCSLLVYCYTDKASMLPCVYAGLRTHV